MVLMLHLAFQLCELEHHVFTVMSFCLPLSVLDAKPVVSTYYEPGNGDIVLDEVSCGGEERRLVDCPTKTTVNDFGHKEDAGVKCDGVYGSMSCRWK